MNKKNILAIVIGLLSMLIYPQLAQAQRISLNFFNLGVSVNATGGDDSFNFHLMPAGMEYDPQNPFYNFSVQTINGNGSFVSLPNNGFLVAGQNMAYTLAEDVPTGWRFVSASCDMTSNAGNYTSSFSDINNGILISAPPIGNISCVFVNAKENKKTPLLFVPGLLGTKIKDQNNNFLWIDPDRMINPLRLDSYSDAFMDPLAFNNSLLPINSGLSLNDVINDVVYAGQTFDYTKSLINEFANQGYVEGQDFFTFPYDWRYGVSGVYSDGKTNSQLLADKIDDILKQTGAAKVDIIAHSLGGLIVKKYVVDNTDSKIGKLVFVGVPNLGSPVAAKALLMGHDFNIFGLNPGEIKKISLNMPAAYDLLPSAGYVAQKSYLTEFRQINMLENQASELNFDQSQAQLTKDGVNTTGLSQANQLHSSDFDNFNAWQQKGIDAYNIVGCKSSTLATVEDWENQDGSHAFYQAVVPTSGDDTVPFESADSIHTDAGKTFYAQKPDHGQMPSQDGIRQTIVNIIAGSSLDQGSKILPYQTVKDNPSLCQLSGQVIEIHSPVDITVTDGLGNVLGVDGDGNIRRDIPGASFEIENGHKYVYLPTGDGEAYNISLKGDSSLQGTNGGTYTLIDEKIVANQPAGAQIFKDQPVSAGYSASLNNITGAPTIAVSDGATITPTFAVPGNSLQDLVSPTTRITLDGQKGEAGFYRSDVTVNLNAIDAAQSGVTPAGGTSISYALDNATSTVADSSASFTVGGEGAHKITYFAQDKLGNQEEAKTISLAIDKTAPQILCGSADGQWHAANTAIACTASDDGSGLANIGDVSFTLSTSVDDNTETDNAATDSRKVCDNAGNCVTAGPITGNKIDRKAPAVTVSATAAGASYVADTWTNQNVTIHFVCSDRGSGAICPADKTISQEGITKVVSATAVDNAGNQSTVTFGPIKIDKTSPEIQFNFDQTAKDLVFASADSLSGSGIVDQNNATVYDAAGNFSKIGFVEKNRAQSLRAQVNGLTYSDGKKADIGNVQLAFAWFYGYTPSVPVSISGLQSLPTIPTALAKSNTLTFLLQQAKLKDGSFIVALYGGKNTLILEYKNKKMNLQTVSGLKLIKFATNAGLFAWSY